MATPLGRGLDGACTGSQRPLPTISFEWQNVLCAQRFRNDEARAARSESGYVVVFVDEEQRDLVGEQRADGVAHLPGAGHAGVQPLDAQARDHNPKQAPSVGPFPSKQSAPRVLPGQVGFGEPQHGVHGFMSGNALVDLVAHRAWRHN